MTTLPDLQTAVVEAARRVDERQHAVVGETAPDSTRRPKRRWATRWLAAGLGGTLAISAGAIFTTNGVSPAFAGPALLRSPAQPVPAFLQRQPGSLLAYMGSGPEHFDKAIPFENGGLTGYLLVGGGGACLSVPDASADDPERERAMQCASDPEMARVGLAVGVSGHVLAAVPADVREPIVRHADGTTTTLHPTAEGLVSAALGPGDRLARFDRHGSPTITRLR